MNPEEDAVLMDMAPLEEWCCAVRPGRLLSGAGNTTVIHERM